MLSILETERGKCFICGRNINTVCHHIFHGTANRRKSENNGLKVNVCPECHTITNNSVHKNIKIDNLMKKIGQLEWMMNRMLELIDGDKQELYEESLGDFVRIFGKNFL